MPSRCLQRNLSANSNLACAKIGAVFTASLIIWLPQTLSPHEHILQLQRRQQRRHRQGLIGLLILTLVLILANLTLGSFPMLADLLQLDLSRVQQQILVELRLPRVLTALVVGAALATSGAVLQVLLRNPLAEPGILGVSSVASVCALATLMFASSWLPGIPVHLLLPVSAFLGAGALIGILYYLVRRGAPSTRILLLGVAIGMLANAVLSWLIFFSDNQSLREMMYWMMGSLAYGKPQVYAWALPVLLLVLWLCRQGRALNQLQLGEASAFQAGIDVVQVRRRLILVVAALSGIAVALAGVIGFVGLIVPHLLRAWVGHDQRALLPVCALGGAVTLLIADLLARNLLPFGELPIGIICSSVGAPLLIYVLMRRHASFS